MNDYTQSKTEETNRHREHLRLQEKWNELQREYNEYEQEYLHSQEDFGTIICILPLCVWVVGFVLLLLVSLFI